MSMQANRADIAELLSRAAAARQQGLDDEERRLLDDALAAQPAHPQALNARGMRALADGDADRAVTCFRAAAASDPKQPILWINLATAYRLRQDDDGEQQALRAALEIAPLNLTALLRTAELHQRRGEGASAAQAWAGIVQIAAAMDERSPAIEQALERGRAFLADHTAALADVLARSLGSRIGAMGSAGNRIDACIDHLLGRRAIYANRCSGVHFPFLPAVEFFDRSAFPWMAALEAHTGEIRNEALALLASDRSPVRPYVRQSDGTPANKWSPLDRNADWSACFLWEYGVRNEEACTLCPATAAALEAVPQNEIPGKAPTAFFSILKPGSHIPAHTGVTNTRTIIHLPLVVPDGCRFRVGGETRHWREGEAFGFDDTIEHEAWNDSDKPRVVLIFDVWNPFLNVEEQALLKEVFHLTNQGSVAP